MLNKYLLVCYKSNHFPYYIDILTMYVNVRPWLGPHSSPHWQTDRRCLAVLQLYNSSQIVRIAGLSRESLTPGWKYLYIVGAKVSQVFTSE